MQKIYIDTVARRFYGSDGDEFPNDFPKIAYKRKEKLVFQLCAESPGYGSPGVNPENWQKDTSFAKDGITALLSIDDDFRRRRQGTLSEEVSSGSMQLNVTLPDTKRHNINASGIIRIWVDHKTSEAVKYDSFTVVKNNQGADTSTFIFSLASATTRSYPKQTTVDIPDSLYAQAAMNTDESDPATGLFVFDISMYSAKLRAKMEYSNIATLDTLAGMELLLFTVNGDSIDVIDNFLCTTVSLPATMAEANPNPQIPDSESDALAAMISAEVQRQFADFNPEIKVSATDVSVAPSAQFYAGESVEAALQIIGGQLNGIDAELAVI